MKKKIMALLLSVCMVMSMMALPALAADLTGHWSANSVNRWVEAGVLTNDDNYDPDAQMTRGEFAKLLADVMGYTESAPAGTFVDIAGSEYASYILKLAAAGVMQGDGNGHASPNDTITRQEIAKMMCVAFDIAPSYGATSFADAGSISDWAKGYVAALAERGMLKGVGGNNVDPWGNITHGAMAALLDQSIAYYVTADTEITGQVDGFVVVAGSAKVTVKDATLVENLIVTPSARNSTIMWGQGADGEFILVEATSVTVTVGEGAAVKVIDVKGNNTHVNVSGTVGSISVSGDSASVTADSGASVRSVSTSGSNVSITANSGATISSVATTGTGSTTVSGSGTVENVIASGSGSTTVTTVGANVTNSGTGSVSAGGKTVASGETAEVSKPAASNNYGSSYTPPSTNPPGDNTCGNGTGTNGSGSGDNTCGDGTTTNGSGSGDNTCGDGTTTNGSGSGDNTCGDGTTTTGSGGDNTTVDE